MFLCCVDESGQPTVPVRPGSGRLFTIGGLIIHEGDWRRIANEYRELKTKDPYNIPIDTEVKWEHLRSRRGPLGHLTSTQRDQFRDELLTWLGQTEEITLVAARTNKQRAYDTKHYISTDEDVYRYTFQFVVERFHFFLEGKRDEGHESPCGIVIQDVRGRSQDERLRRLYRNLGLFGTYFVTFDLLVEALLLVSSEWSIGVQLADFCTGAIHRKLRGIDSEDYDKIAARIRRGPSGLIRGWGIKYFP
jgi:hypothetical protein